MLACWLTGMPGPFSGTDGISPNVNEAVLTIVGRVCKHPELNRAVSRHSLGEIPSPKRLSADSDDNQKIALADALADMLALQMLFAKVDQPEVTKIEVKKGHINRKPLGASTDSSTVRCKPAKKIQATFR
jgi:hypothetical protein